MQWNDVKEGEGFYFYFSWAFWSRVICILICVSETPPTHSCFNPLFRYVIVIGSCILATARSRVKINWVLIFGVLHVGQLASAVSHLVASIAVSRQLSCCNLTCVSLLVDRGGILPRFYGAFYSTTAALIAFVHKAATQHLMHSMLSIIHMSTDCCSICCLRFVYSVWSVSLHLGPRGLSPACISICVLEIVDLLLVL